MERMQMINLGDLYRGAESIKGARTQNKLADLALQNEPQRIENQNRLTDLKLTDAESQQAAQEARLFMDTLGSDYAQLDPQSQQQRWMAARQQQVQMDPEDDQHIPQQFDTNFLQQVQGMAQQAASTAGNDYQFGAQETFKDSEGNLFFGTTKRNAQTGQMDTILSPVGGGAAQPVGGVEMVGSYGQTIREKINNSITEASGTAGAEEGAKLEQQLRFKPQIQGAVKEAELQATARGEALTDLQRAEAAMPGLEETIAELRDLAPIATSTIGGKIFDEAVKQSGFGATEGANARAKFVAIIDNQVLPLLRDTFGAAFTEAEGERLRATMGDPDASPEQKIAQLDAFIKQKYRDLKTKRATVQQLGGESGPVQQSAPGNAVKWDEM